MKKIITSAAMGSLFFAAAMADQAVVTAEEEQPIIKEACDTECKESSFGGINIIAGITGDFSKVKETDSLFKSKHVDRFAATVGLGLGKVFNNNLYAGIEALCELTKSKKYTPEAGRDFGPNDDDLKEGDPIEDIKVKAHGIKPSFGLTVGYVFPHYNTMIYVKPSMTYSRVGLGEVDEQGAVDYKNKSKIAPTVTAGIEKKYGKFSTRVEGEYAGNAKFKFGNNAEMKVNRFNFRVLLSFNAINL